MNNIEKRRVDGIVLLDKPSGLTSNRALQKVKHALRAKKAGHTGSLDPLASGLLPICLGEATKLSSYMLDSNKTYEFTAKWGEQTDTADAEGEVIATSDTPLDRKAFLKELPTWLGEQQQIPPMYSALKINGKRLYDLARQGQTVERAPRDITLYACKAIEVTDTHFTLSVTCSKGTYIRVLAEDMAARLGGLAHIVMLRRTRIANFDVADAIELAALEASPELDPSATWTQAPDTVVSDWPEVVLTEDAAHYVQNGQPVMVSKAPTEGWVRMYAANRVFLGLGQIADNGLVAPKRLLLP